MQLAERVEIIPKVNNTLVKNCDARHRLIVGGRGKGASWSIARILLLEGLNEPLFIPCVREVQKTIRHSVKKLLEDTIKTLNLEGFYTIQDQQIKGINGTLFAFFGLHDYNADNLKSLEGADRCWVAEAQTITRRSINILRPTIRKESAVLWWDFNPRYETDAVYIDYILHRDEHAKVLHLTWEDNPWFSTALRREMEADYKRDKAEADHIWKGIIRTGSELFVCPSNIVDAAMKGTNQSHDTDEYDIAIGADIAHQGGDEIVFYKRQGNKIIDTFYDRNLSAPETKRALKLFAGDTSIPINIDNGSLGMAIADDLEEAGYTIRRINFGGAPFDKKHFDNCVTEMYFNLRDRLEYIDILYDEELRNQLIQRKYTYLSGNKGYEVVRIESKKEYAKHATKINKSPDRADALALCFYECRLDTSMIETFSDYNIF